MSLSHWLQTLLGRWRPRALLLATASTERLDLTLALRKLKPERFQSYRAAAAQALQLEVKYLHLDEYTLALREAATVVRDARLIDPATLSRETFRVSLDRFMTSAEGYYLDPVVTVGRFKTVALQLCEAMEASDDAEYGPAEHNLRMLRPTLLSTLDLTRKLLSVQEQ